MRTFAKAHYAGRAGVDRVFFFICLSLLGLETFTGGTSQSSRPYVPEKQVRSLECLEFRILCLNFHFCVSSVASLLRSN